MNFSMGLCIGFFIGFTSLGWLANEDLKFSANAQAIKSQCEKDLPRNQKCTVFVIAEPEVQE